MKKKYFGTGTTVHGFGREFHLTSERNQTDIEATEEELKEPAPMSNPAEPETQASLLTNVLVEAGRSRADAPTQEDLEKLDAAKFSSEQLVNVQNILDSLNKEKEAREGRECRRWQQQHYGDVLIDIHGEPNRAAEPVYYLPHDVSTKRIAGLPYAVTDIITTCKLCTRHKKCERHRKSDFIKTSVSLCKDSHVRMGVSWDITDPENRKSSWIFSIEDRFDRFDHSKDELDLHERALAKKQKAQEAKRDVPTETQGCQPIEPKWRINELARRIIADYNDDQKHKARRSNLDRKGREYYTKPGHWGGKAPFMPSSVTEARAAHDMAFQNDEGRVERELRVLLAAWYRGKSGEDVDKYDRTSLRMREVWAEKMDDLRRAKFIEVKPVAEVQKKMKTPKDESRYNMTAWLKKDKNSDPAPTPPKESTRKVAFDDSNSYSSKEKKTVAKPKTPKPKAAPSKLTAAEHKLLQRMNYAAGVEATHNAETEAKVAAAKADADAAEALEQQLFECFANQESSSDSEQPAPKRAAKPTKKVSDKTIKPKSEPTKRKATVTPANAEYSSEDEKPATKLTKNTSEKPTKPKTEPKRRKAPVISSDDETSSEDEAPATKPAAKFTKKTSDKASKPKAAPKAEPKKRKAPTTTSTSDNDQPAAKKTRKSYKSSAIIDDSDEDANYQLPNAPSPILDQQREGWDTEHIALEVKQNVKVVQTGKTEVKRADKAEVKEAEFVVEQGTTIVKAVEKKRKHVIDVQEEAEPAVKKIKSSSEVDAEVVVEDPATPPFHDLSTSPPHNEQAEDTSSSPPLSSSTSSSTPSKKVKKVSFPTANISPVLKPRLTSLPYFEDLEGDVPERKVSFESGTVSPVERKRKMSIPYVLEDVVEVAEEEVVEEGEVEDENEMDEGEVDEMVDEMDDEDVDALFEE